MNNRYLYLKKNSISVIKKNIIFVTIELNWKKKFPSKTENIFILK